MDAKVLSRVLNGLGANVYNQGVTVIVQLAGVPILLHAWGAQLYGEWLILFAIPAYLSMADLGFSQSAANDMTARVARGDREGALAVFQSLGLLILAIVAVGLVLTAELVSWLPLGEWLHFQAIDDSSARWTLWLLGAAVFAALPDGASHAGFRASGDYAVHVGLYSTTRLAQFGGVWVVAGIGGGVVAAAAVFCGVRVIGTLTAAMLLVRRHGWLRFGSANARHAELRRLVRPALANMAIPLAQALNIQGMVVVVGAVLGPLAVVVFSTLRTLTRLALQLVLAVAHAAEPELAAAHGAANHSVMRSLFVHSLRAGLWLALAATTMLVLFGDAILGIWTRNKVVMDQALFCWLLASAVASVLWYGFLIVLKAANRHMGAASVYLVASAAVVGLSVWLLSWTGDVADAGLALLIVDVAMVLYTVNAAAPLLQIRPLTSLMSAANPLPLLALGRGKPLVR